MRTTLEKLIAIIGAVLIGFAVYFAPAPLGAVPCNIKPFSAKPTTILSTEKTADIIASEKGDIVLSNALNIAVAFIDAKQSAYKTANGHYFKGNITHNTIPTLGTTALPENNACGNKEGKTWADFGELTSALPFAVGVAPYTQGTNEGYTIEFFVQKGGRTFVKAVSRGFQATERSYDWQLQETDGGVLSSGWNIKRLSNLWGFTVALAADANSRLFTRANGDYAQAADSADLSLTGAYTIDFEIKFNSFNAEERIISKLGAGGSRSYQITNVQAASGDQASVSVTHSSDGTATTGTTLTATTQTINSGTWYRYTVTHDGSGNMTLYVNCTSVATGTNATSAINDNASAFRLGAQTNAPDAQTVEKLDGLLNNVKIYNAVVVPTSANEADGESTTHANLKAYWLLENNGTDSATGGTADTLTFTGASNSADVAGALCASSATVGDESIMFNDIF